MRVALSTPGKFHTFDLARELFAQDALAGICTGYPRFKLRNEGLPAELIRTFPWFTAPYMALKWRDRLPRWLVADWEILIAETFDAWMTRALPECDVFVGLSGTALNTGRRVQQRGGRYVCDRGSSHIRFQDQILREEHDRWATPFSGVDPRVIAREEAEYAAADCITVPSGFVRDSFIRQGVAPDRLRQLPYGVNLSRFQPTGAPEADRFDVLFVGGMSLRKGVQYLVQAYTRLNHPAKSLTFVGSPSPVLIENLSRRGLWPADARVVGHVPQPELKHLMSKSHVMVLPSLEEGLAMVMAQAMACGCPVLASEHTGARDLFTDGEEGFIVPVRDVDALAQRLQQLADDAPLRERFSKHALARVKSLGGWSDYGQRALQTYRELVKP